MWVKIVWIILALVLLLAAALGWAAQYLDWSEPVDLATVQPQNLPYLATAAPQMRGKILAIVTSTGQKQVPSGDAIKTKPAGFDLTELARAYAVFSAHGFVVDIASPQGGAAPYVRDD